MRTPFIFLMVAILVAGIQWPLQAQTTIWSIPDTGMPGFASHAAHAGDFDGDTLQDFIVTMRSDASGALLSLINGASAFPLFQISTPPIEDLDVVGDIDADSFDDFGVVSRDPISGATGLYLYSGATGFPITLPDAPSGISIGIGLSAALEGVGDINRDGHDDFAVALAGGGIFLPGQTCVSDVPGVTLVFSGIDGSLLRSHPGKGGASSTIVTGLSDINGDGVSDYATGGLGRPLLTQTGPCPDLPAISSCIEVHSGLDGSLLQLHSGQPLSGLGIDASEDMNLDGYPDILTQSRDMSGVAPNQILNHIISGADGSSLSCIDESISGQPVYGIYSAGYVDGDPIPDHYVVGTNSIRLVSGANSDTIWSMPVDISTTVATPVVRIGDVNIDQGYELLVTQQNPARVTIISPITMPPALSLGIGYGLGRPNTAPPELSISPEPALGEIATFAIGNGTPGAPGELLHSFETPTTTLPTGHPITLSLPNSGIVQSYFLDANGNYSFQVLLNANAPVIGLTAHTQAFALSGSAPGGLEVTNGLYLRFGPINH